MTNQNETQTNNNAKHKGAVKMKIYSSKKAAINNINVTNYKTGLYCNGAYNSSIKTMDVSNDKIVALYKSYRSDSHGSYVKIYCIKVI